MTDNIFTRFLNPSKRGRLWQIFIFIIFLALTASLVDAGKYYNKGADWVSGKTSGYVQLPRVKDVPFRLGLDLSGGTHLVYKADVSRVPRGDERSAVDGVRDVIDRRVNAFGVAEPMIQVNQAGANDYRLIVDLAGVQDVDQAIKMIGETPILEFKEQSAEKALSSDQEKEINDYNNKALKKAEEFLGKILSRGDFDKLGKEYDESGDFKTEGRWLSADSDPELFMALSKKKTGEATDVVKTADGLEIAKLKGERTAKSEITGEEKTEVRASHILICHKEAENCPSDITKEQAYEKIKKIKEQATAKNFEELARDLSNDPSVESNGGDLGWFGRGAMVKPFEDAVFGQKVGTISFVVETKFGYHLIYKQDERTAKEYLAETVFIATKNRNLAEGDINWKNTKLTGTYLKGSIVQFDPNTGEAEVGLEFNKEGGDLFEEITGANVGKPLAIFLDGEMISAPVVNTKISGGKAVITGNFSAIEAKNLAKRLNAGALPVPITLVSQQMVGASLGKVSVQKSLVAGLWGIFLVAIFMIAFYRLPGVVSVFALAIYAVLLLALFKTWGLIVALLCLLIIIYASPIGLTMGISVLLYLLFLFFSLRFAAFSSWPTTLTLPGLAGFILSIGVAVDANVLIFERFKEEMKNGKPVANALETGFKRAWPSIRDGHFSNVFTCVILYFFSTGMVRGFAITLAWGILVSLFSAVTITRNVVLLLPEKWLEKRFLAGVKRPNEEKIIK